MSIILGSLLLFLGYTVVPNLYARNFSRQVIKKINPEQKEIALTFDDGPDCHYTPALLDLLHEHEVKATFFLVAEWAFIESELVSRIQSEGHEIALHSLRHQNAWLNTPRQTEHNIRKGIDILDKIGIDVKYYRPPWGTFNFFTLLYAHKYKQQVVLWSVAADDWIKNITPAMITEKVLSSAAAGDIIVMHDSGGAPQAPLKTLEALKHIIPDLKRRNYSFITLSEAGEAL